MLLGSELGNDLGLLHSPRPRPSWAVTDNAVYASYAPLAAANSKGYEHPDGSAELADSRHQFRGFSASRVPTSLLPVVKCLKELLPRVAPSRTAEYLRLSARAVPTGASHWSLLWIDSTVGCSANMHFMRHIFTPSVNKYLRILKTAEQPNSKLSRQSKGRFPLYRKILRHSRTLVCGLWEGAYALGPQSVVFRRHPIGALTRKLDRHPCLHLREPARTYC